MVALPPAPAAAAREQLRPRLIRHILPFVELSEATGADVDGLLAQLGLSRQALRDPMTHLPYYQIHWLLEQLIAQAGDPEIGLRASEQTLFLRSEFLGNLVRHVVHSSSDLLTVMQLLAHFATYVARTWRMTVAVKDDRVTSTIVSVVALHPELYDWMSGNCCRLLEALSSTGLRPLEVRLPRARPLRPERYEKFFGAPVVFDAPDWQLVYARDALRAPVTKEALPHEDPAATLTAQGGNALAVQIRTHLLARLAEGVPLLPQVARKLGLSARTLRRRLSEARSSYAELVDEARRERALSLAQRAELDVGRLAELTGFTDASAFARAFRRWTGERPREFMRRTRERTGDARIAQPRLLAKTR